jgi:hypothetical protein
MISLQTAKLLKGVGLDWMPKQGDRFSIPTKGLREEHFIVSEMTVQIETINGRQLIMFNGAAEWAMDYITTSEAVWLPSEEQLRAEIEARLVGMYKTKLFLEISPHVSKCILFYGEDAVLSEAYGQALYHLLSAN